MCCVYLFRMEVNKHLLATKITRELLSSSASSLDYSTVYYKIQQVTTSNTVQLNNFNTTLRASIQNNTQLSISLKNLVYHWLRLKCTAGNNTPAAGLKICTTESLDYLKKAQVKVYKCT